MHSPPHKVAAEIDLSAEAIESRVEDLGSFLKLASSQVRTCLPPPHSPTHYSHSFSKKKCDLCFKLKKKRAKVESSLN